MTYTSIQMEKTGDKDKDEYTVSWKCRGVGNKASNLLYTTAVEMFNNMVDRQIMEVESTVFEDEDE